MTKLTTLSDDAAYRQMIARLLPRGPIWEVDSQPGLKGIVDGSAAEATRIHNRMVDLLAEADPRTTSELLAKWIVEYGLPGPCNELPTAEGEQRAMLLLKVAATGGVCRRYFKRLAYIAMGATDFAPVLPWVTIEERPYGRPFRVDESRVGDPLNGQEVMFYWVMHLPATLPAGYGTVIECLVGHLKPAHHIVEFEYDLLI